MHVETLRQVQIFSKLTHDELEAVARCIVERNSQAGEVLIQEGQPGEALFMIVNGRVEVTKDEGRKTVKLAELRDGAVFGEMSLIDNFPASATVTTTEACTFLLLGRVDLNVLLNWDTLLASKMWRSFTEMLCWRVRESNERLVQKFGEGAGKELIGATEGIETRS